MSFEFESSFNVNFFILRFRKSKKGVEEIFHVEKVRSSMSVEDKNEFRLKCSLCLLQKKNNIHITDLNEFTILILD